MRVPGFPEGSLPQRIGAMVPELPPWDPPPGALRHAAVVLLFIPPALGEDAARIVFMRRSTTVRSHRGQIGFAGGRAEAFDPSPLATALRELDEELGVPAASVVPLGTLPTTSALDGSDVRAVVAATTMGLEAMRPAPDEVAEVFAAPWTAFRPAAAETFSFNIFGSWRTSRVYPAAGRGVWGLTAHILYTAALE